MITIKFMLFVLAGVAVLAVLVALLNTLYHRLVIQRRARKNEQEMAERERQQREWDSVINKGRERMHRFVETGVDPGRKSQQDIVNKINADMLRDLNIAEATHELWCPKCGSYDKQLRLLNAQAYWNCAACGQNFHVKSSELGRWKDRDIEPSPPLPDSPYVWPVVDPNAYYDPSRLNSDPTPFSFGGGNFGGGGAGDSYSSDSAPDSPSSSDDSGSSYDSGSSDSSSDSFSSND